MLSRIVKGSPSSGFYGASVKGGCTDINFQTGHKRTKDLITEKERVRDPEVSANTFNPHDKSDFFVKQIADFPRTLDESTSRNG